MAANTCGEVVDSKLLTLPNGDEADVRVVSAGKALLYVPTSWFHPWGLTTAGKREGIQDYHHNQFLSPPFAQEECPGLIHRLPAGKMLQIILGDKLVSNIPAAFPVRVLWIRSYHSSGFVQSTSSDPPGVGPLDEHGWAQWGKGDLFLDFHSPVKRDTGFRYAVSSPTMAERRNGHPPSHVMNSAGIDSLPAMTLSYEWDHRAAPQPAWRELRERMERMTLWLATPPNKRDNDIAV
jgi:hypothetical protein